MFKNYILLKVLDNYAKKIQKKLIQTSPTRLRPRPSPSAGAGAYRKLQIKVILILPAKTTVRVNINASVQYNGQFSLAFILCDIFAAAKANAYT